MGRGSHLALCARFIYSTMGSCTPRLPQCVNSLVRVGGPGSRDPSDCDPRRDVAARRFGLKPPAVHHPGSQQRRRLLVSSIGFEGKNVNKMIALTAILTLSICPAVASVEDEVEAIFDRFVVAQNAHDVPRGPRLPAGFAQLPMGHSRCADLAA